MNQNQCLKKNCKCEVGKLRILLTIHLSKFSIRPKLLVCTLNYCITNGNYNVKYNGI